MHLPLFLARGTTTITTITTPCYTHRHNHHPKHCRHPCTTPPTPSTRPPLRHQLGVLIPPPPPVCSTPPADNRGGGEQCNAIPVPGCLCLSPPLPVCSYPTLNLTRLCYLRLDAFLTHTAPPPLLLPVPGVLTCAAGASNAALSTRPIRSTSRQSVLDADAQGQDLPGSHPGPDRRSSSGAAVRGGDTLCRVRQLRHCFWTGFTHRSPPHRPTNAKRRMLGPTGIFTQGGPKAGNVLKRFRFSNTT